jgi:hypothetical protein
LAKFADEALVAAQPLEYTPLNLLIRDPAYHRSDLLGKLPFPYLYMLYIGWVPVLLSALWLRFAQRKERALMLCLSSGAALCFFFASGIPIKWLAKYVPAFSGFRNTPLIASLAIPGILGLAGFGLDRLLSKEWPQLTLRLRPDSDLGSHNLNLSWVMAIPLIWSVHSAYTLVEPYLQTQDLTDVYAEIESLEFQDLQWFSPPFGEHYWVEPALEAGLKVTSVVWAWSWDGRLPPDPKWMVARNGQPPGSEVAGELAGIPLYHFTDRSYAYIETNGEMVPCQALGSGGDIQVSCSSGAPGTLIVMENSWSGWKAWQDDERVTLLPNRWLSLKAPAGDHEFRFLYRPADVALGAFLTLIGFVLTIWFWLRPESEDKQEIQEFGPPQAT